MRNGGGANAALLWLFWQRGANCRASVVSAAPHTAARARAAGGHEAAEAVAETGESAMTAARACERKSTVTAIRILKEISFISMCVI